MSTTLTPTLSGAPAAPVPRSTTAPRSTRLQSIDLLRGLVMVIMAIDHIRDFAGVPASGPSAAIFFTRWITHFAAPAFSFFAGTAIFFNARKMNDPRALTRYLLERGILLIVLDQTFLRESWTFNLDYAHWMAGSVIWVLGWSMILMSALSRFSPKRIGLFGLAVIFGQQLVNVLHGALSPEAQMATTPFWQLLYDGGPIPLGSTGVFFVRYSLVPWIGVMSAGYGFGPLLLTDLATRHRLCLRIGLTATALFLVIAGYLTLTHLPATGDLPGYMRFLGQRKYPASELFLLMTLGPTIALIPLAERMRGWAVDALLMFGRVPMFFYLLHLPMYHLLAVGTSFLREGHVNPWLFTNLFGGAPPVPEGYAFGLPMVYLLWATGIVLLYFACTWYTGVKSRHRESWLRYF